MLSLTANLGHLRIKGKKNKEEALQLGVGTETVNRTLDHVYRATGVNGRKQLVAKLLVADIEL